jgi:hypothetical protein
MSTNIRPVSPWKIFRGAFYCFIFLIVFTVSCTETPTPEENGIPATAREDALPAYAVKILPEEDLSPPQLHSDEWEKPVPVPGRINTAGAEDSPFITPDGKTLTFFFTPDPNIPPENQLTDGVTGLYVSHHVNGEWDEPERLILQDPGKLSLDGCQFQQGNILWFCSAREGNVRGVDLWHAEFIDGKWTHWENAGEKLNLEYEVGEMHITADGKDLYFHSARSGGAGQTDIWVSHLINGDWSEPENVTPVNTDALEGWPFITQDGNELWFLRFYLGSPAIFRSLKTDGTWSEPELILSQFAGEPSLDTDGNIYFVHHFFKDGEMLEADIYVAYRKQTLH